MKNNEVFEFFIGNEETGTMCKIALPMRFKKHIYALGITETSEKRDTDFAEKPIKENNSAALKAFSEVLMHLSTEQITEFQKIARVTEPQTLADLLEICLEVSDYQCLPFGTPEELAKAYILSLRAVDADSAIVKTPEENYKDFGKMLAENNNGFFFRNCFYYLKN